MAWYEHRSNYDRNYPSFAVVFNTEIEENWRPETCFYE